VPIVRLERGVLVPTTPGPDPALLPARIGRPALRALDAAGVSSLHELGRMREEDLLRLHGGGPKALAVLREALAEQGLSLRRCA